MPGCGNGPRAGAVCRAVRTARGSTTADRGGALPLHATTRPRGEAAALCRSRHPPLLDRRSGGPVDRMLRLSKRTPTAMCSPARATVLQRSCDGFPDLPLAAIDALIEIARGRARWPPSGHDGQPPIGSYPLRARRDRRHRSGSGLRKRFHRQVRYDPLTWEAPLSSSLERDLTASSFTRLAGGSPTRLAAEVNLARSCRCRRWTPGRITQHLVCCWRRISEASRKTASGEGRPCCGPNGRQLARPLDAVNSCC